MVGRYGIPKLGSDEERPFDRPRMAALCRAFRYSQRSGDSFVLFQMIHDYLFRSRKTRQTFVSVDKIITDSPLPEAIRRNFTYYQGVYFSDYRPSSGFLGPRRGRARPNLD